MAREGRKEIVGSREMTSYKMTTTEVEEKIKYR